MKCWTRIAVMLGALAAGLPSLVEAQEAAHLGDARLALSAERIFGVVHATESRSDYSVTSVALLGGSGSELLFAPHSIPRFAFDAFVARGVSVGLAASFASLSGSSSTQSARVLGLNPRAGFALNVGMASAVWLRGGLSYVNVSNHDSSYQLAAALEAHFVGAIAPHFGVSVGATLDLGVAATSSSKLSQFGLECGLVGWL